MLSEPRKAGERLLFKAFVLIAAFWALSRWLPVLWDKLSPFIIAIPIAAMLQPVVRFCHRRLKVKRSISSLILVLLLIALIIFAIVWLIGLVIDMLGPVLDQSEEIVYSSMETVKEAVNSITHFSEENFSPDAQISISNSLNDLVKNVTTEGVALSKDIAAYVLGLATRLPLFVIYVTFLAMALYFITRDYDEIRSWLPGGSRRDQNSSTTELTNSAIRSLMGYLKVQGTFSLMVLIVSLIYLHAFGFAYASAIAVIAGFLEMIPMIGSGLIYILMGIINLLAGNVPAGIQVLALTLGLQLARRLLEPKLMSSSMRITPLESLVGMFAGWRFGGILGLIGGPVLMSVLVGAFRGKAFASIRKDFRCLVGYFKIRWKRPETEPVPAAEPASPPETPEPPETQVSPETSVSD